MSIVRYDPWNVLDQLRRDMERSYDREGDGPMPTSDWAPAVDIKEDGDCFTISADIPGVDPNQIEVHAENGVLSIKGERESEKKESGDGYKRVERAYGNFYRRFTLPDTADTDKITARSEHGVLTIKIPKHEKLQPRKITVES